MSEKAFDLAEFLVALEQQEVSRMHPAEQELADSLLSIVARHGKFADGDEKGVWVGYEGPEDNDDAAIGVRCGNCVLHETEVVCKIARAAIHPDGKCRLAVIPPGMVKSYTSMDRSDDEDETGY